MRYLSARWSRGLAWSLRRPVRVRRRGGGGRPPERNQHPHLLAVTTILLAELSHQVALLEPDPEEDVAGRRDRERQVSGRHLGRRPERDDEAEVERVAHVAIGA